MPLSERRRPPPLNLVPRQTPSSTPIPGAGGEVEEPESPEVDSPDSVGTTPGLDSSDSESSDEEEEEEKDEPEEGAGIEDGQENEDREGSAPSLGATAPIPSGTSSITTSATPTATGIPPAPQVSRIPLPAPTDPSKTLQPTTTVTMPLPSAPSDTSAGGVNLGTEPQQETVGGPPKGSGGGMSKGAEAALASLTVLGCLALLIGALFFLRKRRAAKRNNAARQAEDALGPTNGSPLPVPETAYAGHMTRTTTTNSLFASAHYERPETVSTEKSQSRVQGLPTPNPFADPPLNKAYDVLRGRPRSTTLTDRGSWVKNPFKDPVSERFDPFGELQAKARHEREKFVEELRLEAEYNAGEKGNKSPVPNGLPGRDVRKGSGVTIEGVGVLDRTNDARGFPR